MKKKFIIILCILALFFGIVIKKNNIDIADYLFTITDTIKNDNISVLSARIKDIPYKEDILKDCNQTDYNFANLAPVAGKQEVIQFIKKNDKNPQIYQNTEENINNKIYRANLHLHTVNSDGKLKVEDALNQAQKYAENLPAREFFYIAFTDHNTVLGSQEVVKTLQKNPNKYNKIKIILGMEIFTGYEYNNDEFLPIHILAWGLNPYDKFLCTAFNKPYLDEKWNYRERFFDEAISVMGKYSLIGVAHPARYISFLEEKKYEHIQEMFKRYKIANSSNKFYFTEGYYQSYPLTKTKNELGDEYDKFINYINDEAYKQGIIRTGSLDTHGPSVFKHKEE